MIRFPIVLTAIYSISLFCPIEAFSSEWGECRSKIAPAVRELREKMKALDKSTPDLGSGPQIDVGSCASRLRKVAGNFLCCRTFANIAPIWEESSCLELKKFYLEKSCDCLSKGGFTGDETLQDSIFEEYAAIKKLKKQALNKGIPNPIIKKYVEGMSDAVDCMNNQSLIILNGVEARITEALKN